jgi:hypothetical protein
VKPDLTYGPYFKGEKGEPQFGVILFALAHGYQLSQHVEEEIEPQAVFPTLAALMRWPGRDTLEEECRNACAYLTVEICGEDQIFGYWISDDAYGVYPASG